MRFLKRRPVAIGVTVLMIIAAIFIGMERRPAVPPPSGDAQLGALDSTLAAEDYASYIWDDAGVLTEQQESQICLYNANWVQRYDSLIAIAVVRSTNGEAIDDYAYALGEEIELGSSDGILVLDTTAKDAYLAVAPDYPMTDSEITDQLDRNLYDPVQNGTYGEGILTLFASINTWYYDNYGLGFLDPDTSSQSSQATAADSDVTAAIILLVFFLILLIVIFTLVDRSRYNTYRQRYYGVSNPPVVFRPILFWHGPMSTWYRRHWTPPPPSSPPPHSGPTGPRGQNRSGGNGFTGFSGPRSSSSGSRPRGGGFSSSPGPSRGGGFSGASRGGGFSGPSRGGGFSGPSRGGGFSGGAGRGSSGNSGGGGSRGGGFGRR